MKKIISFKNANEAIEALDNGGRFYNLFTREDDGEISVSEVGKVAGLFADNQKMVLYFDMATVNLSVAEKDLVVNKMTPKMRKAYNNYNKPVVDVIHQSFPLSGSVIVEATPVLIDSKSGLTGFIMIPVMIGKVMIFSMVPLSERYDVYELKELAGGNSLFVAHVSGKEKLESKKMLIGGIMKELRASKEEDKPTKKFLEVLYVVE